MLTTAHTAPRLPCFESLSGFPPKELLLELFESLVLGASEVTALLHTLV